MCTDPTYKEWKPLISMYMSGRNLMHGSYLQGMETEIVRNERVFLYYGTDPTYKEWKRPSM